MGILRENSHVTVAAEPHPLPSPRVSPVWASSPPDSETGSEPTPKWFALRLRANREHQVKAALDGHGIENLLATWVERVRWSDRFKNITRVIFPGYIFARMIPDQFCYALSTRGVCQLLPESNRPAAIPSAQIENVRIVMASACKPVACEFTTGDTVTIDSGPLSGVSGVVKRTQGSLRVVVSVEMLNRSISVELDAGTLTKGTK